MTCHANSRGISSNTEILDPIKQHFTAPFGVGTDNPTTLIFDEKLMLEILGR